VAAEGFEQQKQPAALKPTAVISKQHPQRQKQAHMKLHRATAADHLASAPCDAAMQVAEEAIKNLANGLPNIKFRADRPDKPYEVYLTAQLLKNLYGEGASNAAPPAQHGHFGSTPLDAELSCLRWQPPRPWHPMSAWQRVLHVMCTRHLHALPADRVCLQSVSLNAWQQPYKCGTWQCWQCMAIMWPRWLRQQVTASRKSQACARRYSDVACLMTAARSVRLAECLNCQPACSTLQFQNWHCRPATKGHTCLAPQSIHACSAVVLCCVLCCLLQLASKPRAKAVMELNGLTREQPGEAAAAGTAGNGGGVGAAAAGATGAGGASAAALGAAAGSWAGEGAMAGAAGMNATPATGQEQGREQLARQQEILMLRQRLAELVQEQLRAGL
jgi:hypothetical protein